jgi:hypothetical protein
MSNDEFLGHCLDLQSISHWLEKLVVMRLVNDGPEAAEDVVEELEAIIEKLENAKTALRDELTAPAA